MNTEEDLMHNENDKSKSLILRDVKYKYKQAERYALKDINLEFGIDQSVAIVGHNGSGKTTLVSIILGLLKSTEGQMINTLGECVAIMQDFNTYQITIRENIQLGCQGELLTDDEIYEILKKVELFDVIKQLPDGLNTKIGQLEDGIELSKGQLQRIAIARLLANKNALIWILDEPTAYLDPIAEIDMYKYILSLAKGKLVFFISHRLGFAKQADNIILMDNGTVLETGNHDELISNVGSKYYEMYQAQKEWYYV